MRSALDAALEPRRPAPLAHRVELCEIGRRAFAFVERSDRGRVRLAGGGAAGGDRDRPRIELLRENVAALARAHPDRLTVIEDRQRQRDAEQAM